MDGLLPYLLKVAVCSALFTLCFITLLRRYKVFQFNRFYILYTSLVSFIIPFIKADFGPSITHVQQTAHDHVISPIQTSLGQWSGAQLPNFQAAQSTPEITVADLLTWIYLLVVILLGFRLFLMIYKIIRVLRSSKSAKIGGHRVLMHPNMRTSTFFHHIFWHSQAGISEAETGAILRHEVIHCQQWHTLDLMMMEIVVILQWFNPLVHLLKRELKIQHEYIADHGAKEGLVEVNYLDLLRSNHIRRFQSWPISSFSSFLDLRVKMLNRSHSKIWAMASIVLSSLFVIATMFSMASASEFFSVRAKEVIDQPVLSPEDDASYKLHWGRLVLTASEYHEGESFYLHSSNLKKSTLLEVLSRNLDFSHRSEKIPLNTIGIGVDPPATDIIYSRENDALKFQALIRKIIVDAKDGQQISIFFNHDHNAVTFNISVEDFPSKKHTIIWGESQYAVWHDHDLAIFHSAGISPYINILSAEQLLDHIRSGRMTLKLPSGKFDRKDDIHYTLLQGPSSRISRWQLIQKLALDGSIVDPVVVSLAGPDGKIYHTAFDDEAHPIVQYKNWNDYHQEVFKIYPCSVSIDEKVSINWGPLDLVAPTWHKGENTSQPKNITAYINGRGIGDGVEIRTIKRIFKSVPKFKINDKTASGQLVVNLRFIDHEDLPFNCDLFYDLDQGQLQETPCYQKIMKQIKPDDHLEINGFYVNGSIKYFRMLNFKVTD